MRLCWRRLGYTEMGTLAVKATKRVEKTPKLKICDSTGPECIYIEAIKAIFLSRESSPVFVAGKYPRVNYRSD